MAQSVDPALVAEGWEPRFVADPGRGREAESLYRQLGYEVLAVPVQPDQFGPSCAECFAASCLGYVTLYTRRSRPGNDLLGPGAGPTQDPEESA